MKIAFIGLGQMGSGMARNLLRAGHELSVYNRSVEKARAIAGARVADSPAEACRGAEAASTMLADDHALEAMVFGERGVMAGLSEGAMHLGASTISTEMARRLAAAHESRGQGYLSSPVFGRPDAAEAKRLVVVVAGAREKIEAFEPVFEAMGRATFIVGDEPWQANATKLCGNFMIMSMLEAFGEAFATLRKSDVDPRKFLEIMNALFQSPVYANYGQMVADEKFEPAGFALKLGLKDARLVLKTSDEVNSPMPMASVIRDRMLDAMAHGQGEMDWSSVAKASARQAGLG
jgi:3-hydroxyisobutyrate dehydrogenase-like beta-hydroxyacid dehydrogenase